MIKVLLFFLATTSLFAQTLYLEPARSKGVSADDIDVIVTIFKQTLEDNGATLKTDYSDADYKVGLSIYKIGESFLLKAKKKKDGKVVSHSKSKIRKIDEADTALGRIAKGILKGDSSPEVGKVLEDEQDELNRNIKAKDSQYYAIAPTWFNNLWQGDDDIGYGLHAGRQWLVRRSVALWLNGELAFNSNAFYFAALIEGSYYFSHSDISPYVGLGFGWVAASGDATKGDFFNTDTSVDYDESASGFALGLSVGTTFFRTSSVNFDVRGTYRYLFDETGQGNPSIWGVAVGLLY